MTSKTLVVKYGGSVLRDGKAIRRAAEQIKEEVEKGTQLVVVVSAIKGVTDQLLDAAKAISPDIPIPVKDHIVRLGEEQSVRLVSAALIHIEVDVEEISVESPSWPIITDEEFGDAEPILDLCVWAVEIGVKPLLRRGKTPVVCGFVGRSISGAVTTLGRGGSDTTATVLANCLEADELVLVKDVGGVHTADPKKVKNAQFISDLSAWEACLLSANGSKVLHEKVFKYRPPTLSIRLVQEGGELSTGGTLITGGIDEMKVNENKVTRIVFVGKGKAEATLDAASIVADSGSKIHRITTQPDVTTIYVEGTPDLDAFHGVAQKHGFKAMTAKENLILIQITGSELEEKRKKILDNVMEKTVEAFFEASSVTLVVEEAKKEDVLQSLELSSTHV
ncbi:MAG: hypothetical protein NWE89_14515 [Candidatus Bathyarchaeota archaeon]|nr:hypothetical protein [Candidatus Bathyarchaeota archaeon]